ncbi:helix-turn-helix domain-containing protein [Arcanobacterium phocisimile]|uniref:Helix-turn-helix domain-containing protein n=1 Tax=Arcanobacterium phocisimile TaxID=1302235 RepID=A0ABX7IG15_9ACTO|nr:helix-turn-helix domain-containing protein [Arcanobacterium phocisimile]QRV02074.1 helix-turn-helix domain-containing protein [Arcanobacterium phocisimile]
MKEKLTDESKAGELLAADDAALLLPETTPATLYRWARQGKIPFVELPSGRKFFRRSDIEAILKPVVVEEVDEG